jgi:2-iminobutanoate/2-iminopropanoate deaminase
VSDAIRIVSSPQAPAAIGPYSQAVSFGELVFASGQIALDPATGDLTGADAAGQTEQAMRNLTAVLAEGGSSLQGVLSVTIYLTDMDDFPAVNEAYARALGAHRPARATVGVASLPRGAAVEIACVAVRL